MLDILLILDVLLHYCEGRTTNRGNEVAIGPKRRNSSFKDGELLTEQPRRAPLDHLHHPMNPKLGIDFDQQVNMVRHDLNFDDFTLEFLGALLDDNLQPCVYSIHQHLPAILWTPHNMVFAGIDHIVVGLVIRHATNIHLEAVYARAIAHPMSKARGLRSRLVNVSDQVLAVAGTLDPRQRVMLAPWAVTTQK